MIENHSFMLRLTYRRVLEDVEEFVVEMVCLIVISIDEMAPVSLVVDVHEHHLVVEAKRDKSKGFVNKIKESRHLLHSVSLWIAQDVLI